jgi:large subunit ribosomal protein L10
MPISKEKKVEILQTLETGLATAETVVFVKFFKLPGKDLTAFRKELRDHGVTYYVAKKTLVQRVLDQKKITGTVPALVGEIALAWGTDPIAPAKGVFEFAKTHKDQVSLVGGVHKGAYMSQGEITELASILGREQLLSKFVGMLNESIARVVRVVNERANSMGAATETAPVAVVEIVEETPVEAQHEAPAKEEETAVVLDEKEGEVTATA